MLFYSCMFFTKHKHFYYISLIIVRQTAFSSIIVFRADKEKLTLLSKPPNWREGLETMFLFLVKVGIQSTALHSEAECGRQGVQHSFPLVSLTEGVRYLYRFLIIAFLSIEILRMCLEGRFSLHLNDAANLTSLEKLFHVCIVEGQKELRKRLDLAL